jgi:hypothetical protein
VADEAQAIRGAHVPRLSPDPEDEST